MFFASANCNAISVDHLLDNGMGGFKYRSFVFRKRNKISDLQMYL